MESGCAMLQIEGVSRLNYPLEQGLKVSLDMHIFSLKIESENSSLMFFQWIFLSIVKCCFMNLIVPKF